MKIQDHINRLVAEYATKVRDADVIIVSLTNERRVFRHDGEKVLMATCSKHLAIKEAQRQAYYQAKIDLDSLLDYV